MARSRPGPLPIAAVALAGAAPAAAPDHAALTRDAQAAFDRRDAAAVERLFCPGAATLRPDGLVTAAPRVVTVMRGAPASGSPVRRTWGEAKVMGGDGVTVVVAPTMVEGRWGKAESLVTMIWRDRPRAGPCVTFIQRAPGGAAAHAATWDDAFLTSETINRAPNKLLADAIAGVRPGRALDVGMGQGRNAVFLAAKGWTVTGFDVSGEGMRLAREQAASAGVRIDTVYASDRDFDFGRDRWDLVAFIYSPLRGLEAKAHAGLRPGGLVVAEAFGDAGDPARAGRGVYYAPGEMRRLFERAGFEIVRYDEPMDVADYGLQRVPLVRLVARKPAR